jgi:hypothetical protein
MAMPVQRSADPAVSRSLAEAMAARHGILREKLAAARAAATGPSDPRSSCARCDDFLAALCAHLAAGEAAVQPVARRRLPDGAERVAAQLAVGRRLSRLMRRIEGGLYGDFFARGAAGSGAWEEMTRLLDRYAAAERELAERLDEVMDPAERAAAAASHQAAVDRAPTRPHPDSPRGARLGRVSNRFWFLADRALDVMDGRIVPRQRRPPRRPADGAWGQYLLGRPSFRSDRPAPPASAPAAGPDEPPG